MLFSGASKHDLRRWCRRTRAELGEPVRGQAAQAICAHLADWPPFRSAGTVLFYLPMSAEVDLLPLEARFPDKRWAVPRILTQRGMAFHRYDPACLVKHPFGMLEPDAALPVVAGTEIDLVLAPGLAYDRAGWRLGYGGGFYDRFLQDFRGVTVGVVYQALLLERLPHAAHDVPVHWLVTELGLRACA